MYVCVNDTAGSGGIHQTLNSWPCQKWIWMALSYENEVPRWSPAAPRSQPYFGPSRRHCCPTANVHCHYPPCLNRNASMVAKALVSRCRLKGQSHQGTGISGIALPNLYFDVIPSATAKLAFDAHSFVSELLHQTVERTLVQARHEEEMNPCSSSGDLLIED